MLGENGDDDPPAAGAQKGILQARGADAGRAHANGRPPRFTAVATAPKKVLAALGHRCPRSLTLIAVVHSRGKPDRVATRQLHERRLAAAHVVATRILHVHRLRPGQPTVLRVVAQLMRCVKGTAVVQFDKRDVCPCGCACSAIINSGRLMATLLMVRTSCVREHERLGSFTLSLFHCSIHLPMPGTFSRMPNSCAMAMKRNGPRNARSHSARPSLGLSRGASRIH